MADIREEHPDSSSDRRLSDAAKNRALGFPRHGLRAQREGANAYVCPTVGADGKSHQQHTEPVALGS